MIYLLTIYHQIDLVMFYTIQRALICSKPQHHIHDKWKKFACLLVIELHWILRFAAALIIVVHV